MNIETDVKPNWFGNENERKEVFRHIAYLLIFGLGCINLLTIIVIGCINLSQMLANLY